MKTLSATAFIAVFTLWSDAGFGKKKSKSMGLNNNTIQIGMENHSFQESQNRVDLNAQYAMLSIELFGPFRIKSKVWKVEEREKDEISRFTLGSERESFQGWFSGLELCNRMSIFRFSFALGFQNTVRDEARTVGISNGEIEEITRKTTDDGAAYLTSIEAHITDHFMIAVNLGANHRRTGDKTDGFAGAGIGIAY
jgi:hypothetical protein